MKGNSILRLAWLNWYDVQCISQFQLRPAPPPGATARHLPASPGGGAFANFALPGGRAFANPGTIPELLTRTWFPIRIITTQKILLEIKQIGSSVKDRKKLKRVVKTWRHVLDFMHAVSSLLIKPELHSQIGSYRCESTFFGHWIKFLLILFEEHLFIFIQLFITLQRSININVNNFIAILKP